MNRFASCLTSLAIIPFFLAPASGRGSEGTPYFEAHIRPLLIQHCYDCHSVEAGKQKGGLLLDSKWAWETGGDSGPALVPGDPESSLIIDAVRRTELRVDGMPPKSNLSKGEIAKLETWISMGAPDPRAKVESETALVDEFNLPQRKAEQWAWQPKQKPEVPAGVHPIDHFIGQSLQEADLRPAIPADEALLRRRLHFDLIGLPERSEDQAPAEIDALIDHLLASPHYGEKWARHWMDLVRYAETCGHEFDFPIDGAYHYRDYLIRALNADVPYDQFVHEHLAGDLLEEPRRHPTEEFNESVLATAHWYFHDASHAPTDVQQDEADHIYNQIDVFGKAFLGLTIACARCHDHKFDPISTADYYALAGYLHGSQRTEHPIDLGRTRERAVQQQRELIATASPGLRSPQSSPHLGANFLAALEALEQTPPIDPWEGDLLADFESSSYGEWKLTNKNGTPFGEAPAQGAIGIQRTVSGFRGKGLVNSYGGNDDYEGQLTSPRFTINRPWINLLVGGGKQKETRVELVVGRKVVHQASGRNKETLEPVSWDVSAWAGKSAVIRIIDERQGGWGHIHVDHLVLSDTPATKLERGMPSLEIATAVAERFPGSDPALIQAWADILRHSDPEDNPFVSLLDPAKATKLHRQILALRDQKQAFLQGSTSFADFDDGLLPEGWNTTGQGFSATGTSSVKAAHDPSFLVQEPGTVSSAFLGRERVGTLRSGSFSIPDGFIHIRMRAQDISLVRVNPDNYHMHAFQPLLFKGTIKRAKENDTGDHYQWVTLDPRKYAGHSGWFEVVDEGHGFASLDEIRFSDSAEAPKDPHPLFAALLSRDLPRGERDLPALLASRLDERWVQISSQLQAGQLTFENATILNSLYAAKLLPIATLFGPETEQSLANGRQIASSTPAAQFLPTMAQGTPEAIPVSIRGSHKAPGEIVPNRNLEGLGGREGSRLDLARDLTQPENPLVARVMVNRLWLHLMGRGIVPTPDDFGPMGQLPTHPELLDWLAVDFMENGWSIKHTIQTIVSSSTYRQSSQAHPDLDPKHIELADPTNALLHRAHIRRLPAESIRDSLLVVSGSWNEQMYGESVATHRTSFMTGRGARGSGPLDGDGRRTIYLSIYRNFLNPFLLTFDMPSPFGPKGRRSQSNVPAQALAMLNDPFVHQQAEHWAQASAVEADPLARIRSMHHRALGQQPSQEQLQTLSTFLGETPDEESWIELAHLLFNTKDFLFLR